MTPTEKYGVSNQENLLKSYEAGNFLETLYACLTADHDARGALALDLVALHNEGLIDVVGAFESLSNKSSNGPDFFLTRHVFEKALPSLDAPALSVMRCVLQLYRDAGQDLAAGAIINGYVDFCANQPSRLREALTEIEAHPNEYADLLTATLSAGFRVDNPYYLEQAIRLCEGESIELKKGAVFSLGNLNLPPGNAMSDSAIAALERSAIVEVDDQILARLVKPAFMLLQKEKAQEHRIVSLLMIALTKGGEYTLHAASEVFGFYTSEISASLLEILFSHFARVQPTNKGTLNNIDYGISHLLNKENPDRAIQFLEDLLLAYPNDLTMGVFDDAAREILGNNALISKVLTRWFLRGNRVLCEGVHIIVSSHHHDGLPLEIDPSELKSPNTVHMVLLARKAIGYLFMQQICVASILISLMRHATEDETLEILGTLLFDPLLLNYTGKTREYVIQQSRRESGKVKQALDNALKAIDDYLNNLRAVGDLAALHPSEAQREAYYRHSSRLIAKSMKDAESKSVFLQLVSKSVLLYGRKSINYVYGADGQSHRTEIPLKSHGIEMEFPRMENLDPFGLDYMLRVFRNERISA